VFVVYNAIPKKPLEYKSFLNRLADWPWCIIGIIPLYIEGDKNWSFLGAVGNSKIAE